MTIAVFGNTFRDMVIQQVQRVTEILQKNAQVQILLEEKLYAVFAETYVISSQIKPLSQLNANQINLAFSVGGDGTFLKTAAYISDKNIPIVGVNCGRLGFLADVTSDEIESVINALLNKEYEVEERTLLQVITNNNSGEGLPFALNEIAILKQDLSSMISIDTLVNNEHILTYQSDGLIIATPTGSTAYSMSVGGPILVPQANNLIISPVASHSLNVRPLVIPDSWEVKLKVSSRSSSFLVSIDGRSQVFDENTELTIRKAPYTIKIVKPEGHTFFKTLKNKLLWGVDKRNT